MPDWINTIVSWLALAQVRAVLVGLIISWNGTQLVKSAPRLVALPDAARRWWTRAIAFVLGMIPTAVLWPGGLAERVMIAAAVGLASPAAYTYGARVLYHFFPWLEDKMSATPEAPKEETPQ